MQIVVPSVDAAHWIRYGTPEETILVNAQCVELIPMIDEFPVAEPIMIDAFDLGTGIHDVDGVRVEASRVPTDDSSADRLELHVSMTLPPTLLESTTVSVLVKVTTPHPPANQIPTKAMELWCDGLPSTDSAFATSADLAEISYPHASTQIIPDAIVSVRRKAKVPVVVNCSNHGRQVGLLEYNIFPGCESDVFQPAGSSFETDPLKFFYEAKAVLECIEPADESLPAVKIASFSFLPTLDPAVTSAF